MNRFIMRLKNGLAWRMHHVVSLIYTPKILQIGDRGIGNKVEAKGKINGKQLKITIIGNNNVVEIGDNCWFHGLNNRIYITGNGNRVTIGRGTTFDQDVLIVACEGTNVDLGEDCMFAAHVTLRTSDQHPIYDVDGLRINPAADIKIGPHVWLGAKSVIMKGIQIGGGTMVGYGSIVTKSLPENCIAAGSPARIIKENIHWERTFK